MDNARELTGRGRSSRTIGQVIKLCLHLGIEPLFIPEHAPWCKGSVENGNGLVERLLVQGQPLHD
jgi:IS30 family transposase